MNLEMFKTVESLQSLLAEVNTISLEVLGDNEEHINKKIRVKFYIKDLSLSIHRRIKEIKIIN